MHRLDRNTRNSRIRVYNFSLFNLFLYFRLVSMKSDSHPESYSIFRHGECILEITRCHNIPISY